jgi:hypothetical protein
MKFYHATNNWTFGIDAGNTGYYFYLLIWLKYRNPAKDYGLGEIRFYRLKWWKTYYEKQKDGKMKIVWKGTILERRGGY